ncbi:MAG: alpha/beta hydrolase [Halioglobus sp.]|nr:alpha/beta hydrolase [Halieaceae bacterium]MDG1387713.1 alpha/beta hydrolase [Halioglobus sp.]
MKPPPLALALSDGPRALLDAAVLGLAAPLLRKMPKATGKHSVMVIPGFLGDDGGNGPLIRFLNSLGYQASGWEQGRNLGTASFDKDSLTGALGSLAVAGGGKVTLIGHSLGGIYAREIARMEPGVVRQVITLGSPFGSGHEEASHASRLYRRLNPGDHREMVNPAPPPVPTTAIYTRGDGVVNWRTSVQRGDYPNVHNIEVLGSHIGLNMNLAVWYWVARKLTEH